jgi:hypothetical protein
MPGMIKYVVLGGLALGVMSAAVAVDGRRPAHAEWASPYAWCAQMGGRRGGGGNDCSFHTFQQCLDTIRGVGGRCFENPHYFGPPEQYYRPRKKRRHR